jgi:hypothetical protein
MGLRTLPGNGLAAQSAFAVHAIMHWPVPVGPIPEQVSPLPQSAFVAQPQAIDGLGGGAN